MNRRLEHLRLFVILVACIAGTQCLGQGPDEWNYLHPSHVTKFGCQTEQVWHDSVGAGQIWQERVWQAEAFAERRGEPAWTRIVAIFPNNMKGRHAAEKACSQWMDGATKRVQRAVQVSQP